MCDALRRASAGVDHRGHPVLRLRAAGPQGRAAHAHHVEARRRPHRGRPASTASSRSTSTPGRSRASSTSPSTTSTRMPVMLEDYLKKNFDATAVFVSPDAGGVERARAYSKRLDASLAIIDKRRERANVSEVMNLIGDVKGSDCIIVDDMIDTAGTLAGAAKALDGRGRDAASSPAPRTACSAGRPSSASSSRRSTRSSSPTPSRSRRGARKACGRSSRSASARLLGEAIKRIHNSRLGQLALRLSRARGIQPKSARIGTRGPLLNARAPACSRLRDALRATPRRSLSSVRSSPCPPPCTTSPPRSRDHPRKGRRAPPPQRRPDPRGRLRQGPAQAMPLAVTPKDVIAVLKSERGQNTVLQMKVDGEKDLLVMIKDYTLPPASTRALEHVDFVEVKLDQPVDVDVPLVVTGKADRRRQRRHPPPGLPHASRCAASRTASRSRSRSTSRTSSSTSRSHASGLQLPEGVEVRLPAEQTLVAVVAPEKDRRRRRSRRRRPARWPVRLRRRRGCGPGGGRGSGGRRQAARSRGAKDAKKK